MKIIGCVNGNNPDDRRCNDHVDFSNNGPAIYEGTDFSCTYCGDEYKDGLTSDERYEAKHNVKHCDNCLSFQPPFTGDMCDLCESERPCVYCGGSMALYMVTPPPAKGMPVERVLTLICLDCKLIR